MIFFWLSTYVSFQNNISIFKIRHFLHISFLLSLLIICVTQKLISVLKVFLIHHFRILPTSDFHYTKIYHALNFSRKFLYIVPLVSTQKTIIIFTMWKNKASLFFVYIEHDLLQV